MLKEMKNLVEAAKRYRHSWDSEDPEEPVVAEEALDAAIAAAEEEYQRFRPVTAQDEMSWRRIGFLEGLLEGIALRGDVPEDIKEKIVVVLRQNSQKQRSKR